MNNVFQREYAQFYDLMYQDKDYAAECDLLETVFQQYGQEPCREVIDLGCGTGEHSIRLAKRGYQVVGVDRSADMLAIARNKAETENVNVSFHQASLCDLSIDRQFDCCICMFAVLCYQLTNADIEAALRTANRLLRPDGVFVFDFWYGPAVLSLRPEQRVGVITDGDRRLIRVATPTLDTFTHSNESRYQLFYFAGERPVLECSESHRVRYFFPLEIDYFLTKAGFKVERFGAFPNLDTPPSDDTWNTMIVARKH